MTGRRCAVILTAVLALASTAAFAKEKQSKKPKNGDKQGAVAVAAPASADFSQWTLEQKEQFLLKAKPTGKARGAAKGITNTLRITLSDGNFTHDASVQTIDEAKPRFEGTQGVELNFRDTYKFNIGAYRLGKMLGIGAMIPPSVDRKHEGKSGSFTWWVDDVLMDEETRSKKKNEPPDLDLWGRQMYIVRVFDQLIYNVDRNLGNLLIDKNWKIWMIDHSRAFRLNETLKSPKDLVKCDRELLKNLKALDRAAVEKELKGFVQSGEVKGMMARRDKIVAFFEAGGPGVLYDLLKKP